MPDKWAKRWKVPKSDGDGSWTVAIDKEGNYGCSCPAWKFQKLPFAERIACHHIIEIQGNGGKEIKAQTLKERNEARLRAFAEKGFRYLIWIHEPAFYSDKRTLEDVKLNSDFEAVKTFKVNAGDNPYRVIVVKEKEIAYKKELDRFIMLLKKCNLRKHIVRNPDYRSTWIDKYWISQEELRESLRKKWFDIAQHIIYNSSGIINPNLPKGSTYNRGEWGKKLVNLERHFKFLK